MPTQVLFFDLGWTLEDETASQIYRAESVVNLCKQFNIITSVTNILDLQDAAGTLGINNVFTYALSQIGLSNELIIYVRKNAIWDTNKLLLYPNVKNVIKDLSQKYVLGIIANQSQSCEKRLYKYNIGKYFDIIISSCDVGFNKPDHQIFQLAISKIDKDIEKYWMVGDRIDNDIIPANELGMKTIRILNGNHRKQIPKDNKEKADYTINEINELGNILL